MKKSLLIGMVTVAAVCSAAIAAVHAQSSYQVYVNAEASPDDWGSSIPSVSPLVLTESGTNGATAFDVDTQVHDALVYVRNLGRTVPTAARARAAASLNTGQLKVFMGADGVDYFLTASASVNAYFVDYVTFDLPTGVAESPVTFSLLIEGDVALNDIVWQTDEALASLGVGSVADTKYIYRGWDGLVSPLPLELSVTTLVSESTSYRIFAQLLGSIKVKDIYSYIDIEQTGSLRINVAEGVVYTSFSGVLLTESGPAIPEPATTGLLVLAVVVGSALPVARCLNVIQQRSFLIEG